MRSGGATSCPSISTTHLTERPAICDDAGQKKPAVWQAFTQGWTAGLNSSLLSTPASSPAHRPTDWTSGPVCPAGGHSVAAHHDCRGPAANPSRPALTGRLPADEVLLQTQSGWLAKCRARC